MFGAENHAPEVCQAAGDHEPELYRVAEDHPQLLSEILSYLLLQLRLHEVPDARAALKHGS